MEVSKINGYDIKDKTSRDHLEELDNNIETISDSYIIDEITKEELYYSDTKTNYYVLHVPHTDSKGNIIKLKRGFAQDEISDECIANETARDFANRKNATLCVNASIYQVNSESEYYDHIVGLIINDEEIISNYPNEDFTQSQLYTLGIKEDNTLVTYPYGTSSDTILNDGCINTVSAFEPIMVDGEIRENINTSLNQWNILGQNTDTKDFYFIACDGKGTDYNRGMTLEQLLNILKNSYNCDFAYRLDGGGSTSLIYKGEMINKATDNNGYRERNNPDFIYFSKDITSKDDKEISDLNKRLGEIKKEINDIGINLEISEVYGTGKDLNNINHTGTVYCTSNCTNAPYSNYDSIIYTTVTTVNNKADVRQQIAIPYGNNNRGAIKIRVMSNSVWYNWYTLEQETEWTTLTNEYGSLKYKIKGKLLYLNGSFSGFSSSFNLTIPSISLDNQHTFLCAGSGTGSDLKITKAWLTTSGQFGMAVGTGDTTTTYNVCEVIPLS